MFMIFPYTQGSAGAKAIAEELSGKRILRSGSSYVPKDEDVIINWGASDCPFPQALNYGTKAVTNKIAFFDRLKNKGLTPRYTTSREAAEFMTFPVFCRTTVEGKDGEGIVVAQNASELVPAKLYVEGVKKTKEFRIHVGRLPNGESTIIGVQQKFVPDLNVLAHSSVWAGDGTNFVWTVNGLSVSPPTPVPSVALKAFDEFPELTFGAFDVVYEEVGLGQARAYVLEINSAPTVTPKTAEKYGEFFRKFETASPPVVEPAPVYATVATAGQPVTAAQPDPIHVAIEYIEKTLAELKALVQ